MKIRSITSGAGRTILLASLTAILAACFSDKPHKPLIGGIRAETTQQMETPGGKPAKSSRDAAGKTVADADGLELPAPVGGSGEIILRRTGYTVSYNASTRLPNWVAWHLTADRCTGKAKRQQKEFHEDEDVASRGQPTGTTTIPASTAVTCVLPATTNGANRRCTNHSSSPISVRRTPT